MAVAGTLNDMIHSKHPGTTQLRRFTHLHLSPTCTSGFTLASREDSINSILDVLDVGPRLPEEDHCQDPSPNHGHLKLQKKMKS